MVDALVARMEAAGRSPGRSTAILFLTPVPDYIRATTALEWHGLCNPDGTTRAPKEVTLVDALVARMEAAGRNPGRSAVIIFFNSLPGLHPGYHSAEWHGLCNPDGTTRAPKEVSLGGALVARMEAAGRSPGRGTAIIFYSRPGLHPGYHSAEWRGPCSPDEGRRPESGKKHRHHFFNSRPGFPPKGTSFGAHPGYHSAGMAGKSVNPFRKLSIGRGRAA